MIVCQFTHGFNQSGIFLNTALVLSVICNGIHKFIDNFSYLRNANLARECAR